MMLLLIFTEFLTDKYEYRDTLDVIMVEHIFPAKLVRSPVE